MYFVYVGTSSPISTQDTRISMLCIACLGPGRSQSGGYHLVYLIRAVVKSRLHYGYYCLFQIKCYENIHVLEATPLKRDNTATFPDLKN